MCKKNKKTKQVHELWVKISHEKIKESPVRLTSGNKCVAEGYRYKNTREHRQTQRLNDM